MPEMPGQSQVDPDLVPEDEARVGLYYLLAGFLSAPPGEAELAAAASIEGDGTPLGKALTTFAHLCARSDAAVVKREYHDLFIGVGRGELLPYASYYLTGFLNEKPLSRLRADMRSLGLEPEPEVKDPEDHIAALCEMMGGFIGGAFGEPLSVEEQKAFFDRHIASWAGYFFRDLKAAKSSVLYAGLGAVGSIFMTIEEEAFRMVALDTEE
ncbi:MAG: molecular chaperone TorD family protein [Hyphomicrobiaceae bacterium]